MSAQNIANITTTGYKRSVSFEQLMVPRNAADIQIRDHAVATDFSAGKQIDTGNPADLAISGNGFFTVAAADQFLYTRLGQFQRTADGRLATSQGFAIQTDGGGDLVLKDGPFEVTPEGVVLQDGIPLARLAIADIADRDALRQSGGGLFALADGATPQAAASTVRQGALESSNVATGEEMVALMQAVRRAETGQRLIGVYDELMGRALTAFGQT